MQRSDIGEKEIPVKMRFRQLDRITELVPGERIVATKKVTGDEDYLRDHFPLFPVMPGVLMLEGLFQASCWLVRATENFENAVLVLKEAKNVKFADFMQPGQEMELIVEIFKIEDSTVTAKASCRKGDVTTVSAQLVIGKSNLGDTDPGLKPLDAFLRHSLKQEMSRLQSES